MKVLFREQQRFKQVWLWVVILGVAAMSWAGFIYKVILGGDLGSRSASAIQLAVMAGLLGVGLPLFFYSMKLTTKVYPGLLTVQFSPFHLKAMKIPLHELRNYESVTYNPILDYGGWGIRWSFNGKAYNTSGNKGVQLYFYNKKPLLIGSQRPQQLLEAIRKAKEIKRTDV
ncbi:DUF6141 family protein [Pontibacter vulgaris]|uniref:DUF6141 family protein n=1 Tax=Pontibacter vulgaris TaxID=2905679 RepID=UPI001FA710E5|nr:DUF6141 family protein [Pontibacter vulgaris]